MIPVLVGAGLRVVAPTSSASDAPTSRPSAPTTPTAPRRLDAGGPVRRARPARRHARGQDWGGLIGLRLVAEHPDRFAGVVAANTFLPTGDRPPGGAFMAWQQFSQEPPELPGGRHRQRGCTTDLTRT